MFEEKKRSSTQVNEYPESKNLYKFNLMDEERGRRLKTLGFPDD